MSVSNSVAVKKIYINNFYGYTMNNTNWQFKVKTAHIVLIIFILITSVSLAIQGNGRQGETLAHNLGNMDQYEEIHRSHEDLQYKNDLKAELSLNPPLASDQLNTKVTSWEPRGINPDTVDPAAFVSYWDTSLISSGSSSSNKIKLPLTSSGTYNFTVYWGDGLNNTITTYNEPAVTHSYATTGVYNITITGTLIGWKFGNTGDRLKLMEIAQWGDLRLGNTGEYFHGSSNLRMTANDTLDLTGTTTLRGAFHGWNSQGSTGDMNSWDVSHVTDMEYMFAGASSFNQPLNNWDVSKVTNMGEMFQGASSFNQPLNSWDVSQVTDMEWMFSGASSFNQPLNSWNVSKVTNMYRMFALASSFNQPLNSWNVSQVTNMEWMFFDASSFNQSLNNWDVSKVTSMKLMFYYTSSFNQPLNSWNVSKVTNMDGMFESASSFNQPLNSWDVSQVTNMGWMFSHESSFNQPLNSWDVSKVTSMRYMFFDTGSFNQPLGNWNVSQVTDMANMFSNVGLSVSNYDNLLTGWSALNLQYGVNFDAGYSKYSTSVGEPARTFIVDTYNWIISDKGVYINSPPSIDHPADISYTEGSTGNQITWNPTDNNPSNYTITQNGTQVDSGTWISGSSISINVDGLSSSVYTYQITVNDLEGLSASDTVIVTVSKHAPSIDHPADISYTEGSTGGSIIWNATDDNPSNYAITQNGTQVDGGTWISGSSISINVDGLSPGVYSYQITVYDLDGLSASDTVTVTVSYQVPTINHPTDISYSEGRTGHKITWNPTDNNPSNYTITQNGTQVDGGTWISGSSISINVDGLSPGVYSYQITVNDLDGLSASDTVIVTVLTYPTIDHPADISYTEGSTGHNITWNPTDDNPSNFTITINGTLKESGRWYFGDSVTINVDGLSPGVYSYQITVYDLDGLSASDIVVVTVIQQVTSTTSETTTSTPTTSTTTESTTSTSTITSTSSTTTPTTSTSKTLTPINPTPLSLTVLIAIPMLGFLMYLKRKDRNP